MIEGLNVAAIAFALAACAATIATIEGIDRALATASDWIENRRAPQPDEAQLLLAALCEPLHERLQPDGTPPRTVINLTAGQWHEVPKQRRHRRSRRDIARSKEPMQGKRSLPATPRLKPLIAFGEFFSTEIDRGSRAT